MNLERLYQVIVAPHMSEKSAIIMERSNDYVFHVKQDATKSEIKAAVEELFKTKVKSVRVLNMKSKPKRFGKVEGKSKAWKKAYVTLQVGQRIEFVGAQ